MGRRNRGRRGPPSPVPLLCFAFGLGVLLALCFPLQFVLFFAAVFLIVLGFQCRC